MSLSTPCCAKTSARSSARSGSSSTISARRGTDEANTAVTGACSPGSVSATGSATTKVAPPPGVSSKDRVPPWLKTMLWHSDRPSPVPVPTGLVVKKGSKMRDRTASGTPLPLSATLRRTMPAASS